MSLEDSSPASFDAALVDPKLIEPAAGAIRAHAIPAGSNDAAAIAQSANEVAFYDKKKEDLAAQEQQAHVADINAARTQRAIYAACTFGLVLAWVALVFYVLRLQFWSAAWGLRQFSDQVLIVFMTTTTANIIGTFYIVLRSIFRASDAALTK